MYNNIDDMLKNARKIDVPNSTLEKVDGVLKNIEQREVGNRYMKKKFVKSIAIAAAIMIFMISAAVFSMSGGLDGLIARFNPAFGFLAQETLAYTEDGGIRIEVIGAQYFGDSMLLYLTVQDISGQERITRYVFPDFEIHNEIGAISSGGGSSNRLHFDADNNKIYLEVQRRLNQTEIQARTGLTQFEAEPDVLYVVVDAIRCYAVSGYPPIVAEGDWRIRLELEKITASNIVMDNLNITAGDIIVEYISISPLGVQLIGAHSWSAEDISHPRTSSINLRVESSNRTFNIRPRSSGAGISPDGWYDFFFSFSAPLDMENITAIVVNSVRIPLRQLL